MKKEREWWIVDPRKVLGGAEGEKSLGGVVETEDCVLWVLVGG